MRTNKTMAALLVLPALALSVPAFAQNAPIGEDSAIAIALTHAGLTAEEAGSPIIFTERADGRMVYDVEWRTADGTEYDYEIDVESGEILAYDHDAEDTAVEDGGAVLTADAAKRLALSRVEGASLSDIRGFETDRERGRLYYEGEIVFGGMEYEFEIDAAAGTITGWEQEKR